MATKRQDLHTAALRSFDQQEMLQICLQYIANISILHREEDSLNAQRLSKDHSWIIAENSLGVKEPQGIFLNTIYKHKLFGRVSRKIICSHPKNKLQHIQLSSTTGTSNGTGFYGKMKKQTNKQRKSFFPFLQEKV